MPQQNLGRYRLLSELGRGAMGHVFLAHDPEIDRNVALKTIQLLGALPEKEREETRERVYREARAAGKLLHPGIVTLFDVGDADGTLFLAMEHVEGETLDLFCKSESRLAVESIVSIVAGVAEALEYAHHNGVIHRDIKPANLIRVENDRAKIMDFGLARASEAQVTQDGALFGTPSYMSPEQIRGEALDGRSDLFSLGVVLYELLSGERPFAGDSVSSILYRIVHEPAREIVEVSPQVAEPFQRFLQRALAKDRDERFPHGGAFAAALRAAGDEISGAAPQLPEMPTSTSQKNEPPQALPARRSSRRSAAGRGGSGGGGGKMALLLLIVLAALVAAGWFFRDRLPESLLALIEREPEIVWLETLVVSEPPGLTILVNGEPLEDPDGRVRFAAGAEAVTVSTESGCRTVERPLTELDAGGEVVLLVESDQFEGAFELNVAGAIVTLNGDKIGVLPQQLSLDLCQENRLAVSAPGFQPGVIELAARMRPSDVRGALAAFELSAIPMAALELPSASMPLVWYVDGQRLPKGQTTLDLAEGEYRIRFKNDRYWVDERRSVKLVAGEVAEVAWRLPSLTTLVVQAFPANCTVSLRKPGGRWKEVDETPASLRLATGEYEVRVTLRATGASKEQKVTLRPGENPPLRVSFGAGN
jgi:hypothetical protein